MLYKLFKHDVNDFSNHTAKMLQFVVYKQWRHTVHGCAIMVRR